MKKSLIFLIAVGCSSLYASDDDKNIKPAEQTQGEQAGAPKWFTEFTNIPEAKRNEFVERCNNASRLFNEKRIFECMMELEKAEEIYTGHPQQLNLMGACYVEFRNFEKARQYFKKALEITPDNVSVHFNLAEVEYVSHSWKAAADSFERIYSEFAKNPKLGVGEESRRISEFKAFVAKTKLGDKAGAEKLRALYTDESDTPFYYMANAVNLFEEGKKEEAGRQVYIARAIYGDTKGAEITALEDSMVEAGYLSSFYGGANEKGSKDSKLPEDQ